MVDVNNTMKENLYETLNELLENQFKEFTWRLPDIDYDGKPNICRGHLEKTDKQTVVDLMIQNYGEDVAVKVCICVLQKCNRRDLVAKLEKTIPKVADVVPYKGPYISGYRNHIKRKFSKIEDPNSCFCDKVYLNQRYSKLIIIDKQLPKKEREHEIMASGRKHVEIMNMKASSSITIETLFKPDQYGLIPQVVVLQGAAGIGKTMTARKIMFDWASEQLYQDLFNYVFYINCREVNLHTDSVESSIAEIISKQWPRSHAVKDTVKEILRNPEKLLFIIDGFDELRFSLFLPKEYICTDPWEKAVMSILLRSLFQKKVLPESYLIITTRPTALESLYRCLENPYYVEILGLSIKERKEYFHNFFENKDQAIQALTFVKQNDTLFTMCVIPLVCWIICTVMKQEMEREEDSQQTPYTLTAVYMLYLSSLLKFHHQESNQDIQRILKGLCSLAAEGIWKQQVLFTEEELQKHNLDQEDTLPLFLNKNIFTRDINRIYAYNFIHLSFQEFFAALFYILEEEKEHYVENQNENLVKLLESSMSSRLDLAVTVRFLFGFLNEKERMKSLKKEFGWKLSPKIKQFLTGWVKNSTKKWKDQLSLEEKTFSYLYETQDDHFVKNALEYVTEVHHHCESVMGLMILTYCIQHCTTVEDLCVVGFERETERELLPSENLLNNEETLEERSMELFFDAMRFLRNLRILRLHRNFLTESCCRHLATFLRRNQRVRKLYLPNGIDLEGMELLCEGLKHPECKLEQLWLVSVSFPESFCRLLAEVLRGSQSLRLLDLSPCDMAEKAMKQLCEGLKHPDCKLEKLRWCCTTVSQSCCKHLAGALKESKSLMELALLPHDIGDKALQLLCEGLKHPECKLQKLKLSLGILGKSSCRHLAEVLRESQTLTALTLLPCHADDDAVGLLCEELKQPFCKVEKLQFSVGFLTESSCRHLGEVLRRNQGLRKLDISHCTRDDKAFELLYEELKHPKCKLEKLKLQIFHDLINKSGYNHLAESVYRHLGDVLRENSSLKELDLTHMENDSKELELIFEGLKHPNCKLEKLSVHGGFLTESSCRHLAEVLKKNQRLREVSLWPYRLFDKAAELLREGLKHPDCKLEKLRLFQEFITVDHKNGTSIGLVEKRWSFLLYCLIHLLGYIFIFMVSLEFLSNLHLG